MAVIKNKLLKHTYNDSVVLMQYTVELEMMPGIKKAAVMMGTSSTIELLRESSLLTLDEDQISYDDILIAVEADSENAAESALLAITGKLQNSDTPAGVTEIGDNLDAGEKEGSILWRELPADAEVALISVPGQYAAAEAWQALKNGLHVMLFSNHVSLEDEVALKKSGRDRGLLVMGPDCGTAILNGVPLGFANKVRRGNIGIVAAAGSGLQALTCQIDQMGCGISHAIGTGGRDLSADVMAITTKMGLAMLKDDPGTEVICVLSKPPDPEIAEKVLSKVKDINKPAVICLLGQDVQKNQEGQVYFVETIDEMAETAVSLSKGEDYKHDRYMPQDLGQAKLSQKTLRGFYSGGTLAYETNFLLKKYLGEIYSNIAVRPEQKAGLDELSTNKHIILDLGTDQFTQGRPHPMIDGRWRSELILQTAENPQVGVVLFDLILGLGADPDPASSIVESITEAKKQASHPLEFIGTIIGTKEDPQDYDKQVQTLQKAGVMLAKTNAEAALLSIEKLLSINNKENHEN